MRLLRRWRPQQPAGETPASVVDLYIAGMATYDEARKSLLADLASLAHRRREVERERLLTLLLLADLDEARARKSSGG